MGGAVKAVTKAVSDVGNAVKSTVSKAGDVVGEAWNDGVDLTAKVVSGGNTELADKITGGSFSDAVNFNKGVGDLAKGDSVKDNVASGISLATKFGSLVGGNPQIASTINQYTGGQGMDFLDDINDFLGSETGGLLKGLFDKPNQSGASAAPNPVPQTRVETVYVPAQESGMSTNTIMLIVAGVAAMGLGAFVLTRK